MERIRVQGLEKSFGIYTVFSQVSFELKRGERLGLVGPNGAGKSTLLKCILGIEEVDAGQVMTSDHCTIGYLQQDVNLGEDSLEEEIQKAFADIAQLEEKIAALTQKMEVEEAKEADLERLAHWQDRLEWLGGYDYEAQSRRIAYGLGFTEADLSKTASAFSGGQKTRINLAKALVRRPDFLLLDEPTNHLDMEMLEWLEKYISSYRGGILIVSHDRYFLNRVTTGIVELDHHKTRTYRGNYSTYLVKREEQRKAEQRAYDKQQEYIKKTEAYIDKYRAGIKSKMARGRQSQLNRLERLEAPETSHTLQFQLPAAKECADRVLVLKDVSVGYGDKTIIHDLSTIIRRGEAVGLIGPNGAGKSTLVKAIMGEVPMTDGIIDLGNRVQVGYFSQEHEELHEDWTAVDEIRNHFNYSEDKARSVLGAFLFRGDDVFKKIKDLSGGERARIALLKLFLQGDNFLILDEPTNHLDIPTREVVERALQQFSGTLLVISHDRYFLDRVTTRTLCLEDGGITEFAGNYSYYKEKVGESAVEESVAAAEKEEETTVAPVKKEKAPNAYMREKRLAEVETEIARLEATMKMYEQQLAQAGFQEDLEAYQSLADEMSQVQEKLTNLYETWEALAEE